MTVFQELVSVKGDRDGLRVVLDDAATWEHVLEALREHLGQAGSFFAGADLVLEVGNRELSEQALTDVLAVMEQHGLRPAMLASTARTSRNVARAAGLTSRPTGSMALLQQPAGDVPHAQGESTFVCRTLHSGQVLRHPGHITLIGDVNPGAQVIAGGSIVIWGRLRGLVHACALGGEADAVVVCALDLRPTQLRIAGLIARTPEDAPGHLMPEIARIVNDTIVVEPWEAFKATRNHR